MNIKNRNRKTGKINSESFHQPERKKKRIQIEIEPAPKSEKTKTI